MENLPDNIDSKYRFIVLAAKRTAQLQNGAPLKIEYEEAKDHKYTTIAQKEAEEGLVKFRKIREERSEVDIAREAILGHDFIPDLEE
jgi:DNA-directed RNA polymerase omega subunit